MLVVKNPPVNAGDVRDAVLNPGSGRPPEGGNGNPLQYSRSEETRLNSSHSGQSRMPSSA